jgi:hypothetical protein
MPAANLRVGPFTVDFCWVDQRLMSRRTATHLIGVAPLSRTIGAEI